MKCIKVTFLLFFLDAIMLCEGSNLTPIWPNKWLTQAIHLEGQTRIRFLLSTVNCVQRELNRMIIDNVMDWVLRQHNKRQLNNVKPTNDSPTKRHFNKRLLIKVTIQQTSIEQATSQQGKYQTSDISTTMYFRYRSTKFNNVLVFIS